MRKYVMIMVLGVFGFSGLAQNLIAVADTCYKQGDYECARDKYSEALKNTPDNNTLKALKENADICALYRKDADENYRQKNYREAQKSYQEIVMINPVDRYAKMKLDSCILFLKPVYTLKVSTNELSFSENGGVQKINVMTNAESYLVTAKSATFRWDTIPWITITDYPTYFYVTCEANWFRTSRTGTIYIKAENKEDKINIRQKASNIVYENNYKPPKKKFHNLTDYDYQGGVSTGYVQVVDKSANKVYEGAQILGLRRRFLDDSGFGFIVGVYWENYFNKSDYIIQSDGYEKKYDEKVLRNSFFNLQLHGEYRLNFSKFFNLSIFCGFSGDYQSKPTEYEEDQVNKNSTGNDQYDYYLRGFLDVGGSIRFDRIQIQAGYDFGIKKHKKIFTIAYLFDAI